MAQALDRLVRKEVSLGAIREIPPPQDHIGLTDYAPWMDVDTDDVIFEYIKDGLQEGLAPARAEDAEAELAQKDELLAGEGRAAVVDWSLKDKYTASDVSRFREALFIQNQLQGSISGGNLSRNFVGRTAQDFQARLARHDRARRRKLDNRLEWLIMTGLTEGTVSYNDGRVKFTVNWGRPAGQHKAAPAGGLWNTTTCDPIGDILAVNQTMFDLYGIKLTRGLISRKIVNNMWKSNRFLAAVGLPVVGGTPNVTLDPNYLSLNGYTPEGALATVEAATGVTFKIYDSVYRTRPIGSTTFTNVRFTDETVCTLLPTEGDLGEIDDTEVGFAKTMTAPHPEGNWSSSWYEWEDEKRDPWLHVRGTGIKAFPIFPYLEYTYSMKVLP